MRFAKQPGRALLILGLVLGGIFFNIARAAEEFGEIAVFPNAIYTGNTFHGYAESRVALENHSRGKTHVVTLVYPSRAYGNFGNSIGRITRTVSLAPGAREVVSLMQPPLPAQGDGSIGVEVDGQREGEIRAPNANNHCNLYSRSANMATVFISRSLDFDAAERVFQATHGAFTASMAVGPPDAAGRGYQPNCWMPDPRTYGRTNWLELDYATPQTVTSVTIYSTQSPFSSGTLEVVGISGTNVAKISLAAARISGMGSETELEYSLPPAGGPVKMLRLDLDKTPPHTIAIDAVQISNGTKSQYASGARASSDNGAAAPRFMAGGATTEMVESLRAESPPAEWSGNWLAYSPFDAVVLSAGDLPTLPPAVVAALGDYAQAGGNIVMIGKCELPASWHSQQKPGWHSRNDVEYSAGFGRCLVFGADDPEHLDSGSTQKLREIVRETARYWQSLPADSGAANSLLPVVENLKIPTRGIVVIMLAFIVVIGPVNMFYLNRINRRTWMLWSIPAISLGTTLLVFAYSLLREGVTADTRIAGLTVLDQTSHHAATVGSVAFYCPLTPSRGLDFNYGTEATALVASGFGARGASREVDWSQSQQFRRGWISARVPAHFHVRKSETRRERIQIVNENGKLQIVNGLGARVKSLWLEDASMAFYEAGTVEAGQKSGLIPVKPDAMPGGTGAAGLWHEIGFAANPEAVPAKAGSFLQPNTYIAVLEGNPFIEDAFGSRHKRTRSSCVVFGILESGRDTQ
jgi:hypothetical protein